MAKQKTASATIIIPKQYRNLDVACDAIGGGRKALEYIHILPSGFAFASDGWIAAIVPIRVEGILEPFAISREIWHKVWQMVQADMVMVWKPGSLVISLPPLKVHISLDPAAPKCPSWSQLIPDLTADPPAAHTVAFDPALMARLANAIGERWRKDIIMRSTGPRGPLWCRVDAEGWGLIMPIHVGEDNSLEEAKAKIGGGGQ